MNPANINFGLQVRRIRQEQNISQEKLAELSNVDRAHMGHIERGSASPTLKKIIQISTALGVDPKELFNDTKKSN
jgi:transcriptional regulator with XRE-family HTH domain